MAEITFDPDPNAANGFLVYISPDDTCKFFAWASEPSSADEHTFVVYPPNVPDDRIAWHIHVGEVLAWCRSHGAGDGGKGDPSVMRPHWDNWARHTLSAVVVTMNARLATLFKLRFGGVLASP